MYVYGFMEAIFGFGDVLAFREDAQLVLDGQLLVQLEMWPPSRGESVVSTELGEIGRRALVYVSSCLMERYDMFCFHIGILEIGWRVFAKQTRFCWL